MTSAHELVEDHPLLKDIAPHLRLPVSKRICYSGRHGFCYFRVPKAANSTVVLTLAHHAGVALPEEDPTDPERRVRAAKQAFKQTPGIDEVQRSFRFTVVRNPYSRVLSAYRDKAARKNFAKRYGFQHRFFFRRPFTFLDFLKRLDDGVLRENLHWAPQVEIIPYDLDKLDRLGRVESIDDDLAFVIETVFHCPMKMLVREHRRTGADSVINKFLGSQEKAIIQRLYAGDFERLYPQS
jgi:hypothetical protein